MNYRDVYFRRINHLGENVQERVKNDGIRTFEKWLVNSPHTVRNLSVERGIHFDGILLTSKDKEYQKILFLNVANNVPLVVGDIMTWIQDDGSEEKWILFQEKKKVNGSYRVFWMVRCNYLLKWVDKQGHLQQSWSYVVSSVDDKIKGNFRTWHALITPQPNKYAEILMPRYSIERATNFIVEDESWTVVEYDHTSVPGIIYLSLTENKVNMVYDDLENNIADTDRIAKYELLTPEEVQTYEVGEEIKPLFTVTKNGTPIELEVNLLSTDKKIAKTIDGKLIAQKAGETSIIIQLINDAKVCKKINIKVVDKKEEEILAYIDGSATIMLDRAKTYKLSGNIDFSDVTFSLDTNLAKIVKIESNSCTVQANAKNELGTFTLTATYGGKTYTKEIKVIPLW